MNRPTTYRRRIVPDGEFVWVPLSVLAEEFQKDRRTMLDWCISGYWIELGFKMRRECRGHWRVGVPLPEYAKFRNLGLLSLPD